MGNNITQRLKYKESVVKFSYFENFIAKIYRNLYN